jgi:hypothetical protein
MTDWCELAESLLNSGGIMRSCSAIICLLILSCVSALADPTRDEVMSGAARCEGIADNRAWLDCFYGSAQPMRALLNLPPAPPSQTKLVPPPGAAYTRPAGSFGAGVSAPEKSGGFWADLLGSTKPLIVNMAMTDYSFNKDGLFTVTLTNGQVWREAESSLIRAKWMKPAKSYRVTIAYSSLDTFNLRVRGDSEIYTVHRVQ